MSFEFFGFTFTLQELIIYLSVAISIPTTIYIFLKLKRITGEEQETEVQVSQNQTQVTLEMLGMIREMWRHQAGLNPGTHSKPENQQKNGDAESEKTILPSTITIDETKTVLTPAQLKILKKLSKHV